MLDFMVQLETMIAGEPIPVVRFDCRHGCPHRDRLDRKGRVIAKEPMPSHFTRGEALQVARQDLEHNWERELATFLRRRR